jgi:hypothetical protein
MKAGTIGCPERFIRNYHSSLPDDTEEKSSHYVWVSSKDKVYVISFGKSDQTIPQLKNIRKKKVTEMSIYYTFQRKTNHKLLVFQNTSCSHEGTGRVCVQVLFTGDGTISTTEISKWYAFN